MAWPGTRTPWLRSSRTPSSRGWSGRGGGGGAAGGDGGWRLAAAVGLRRGGADPGRDGGGFLDLWPGRERGHAGYVRPVLLRAGPDQPGARARRTVRARDPRGVRDLTPSR